MQKRWDRLYAKANLVIRSSHSRLFNSQRTGAVQELDLDYQHTVVMIMKESCGKDYYSRGDERNL